MESSFLVPGIFVCGIIGPIFFVAIFFLDGTTRPDYDPLFHLISDLSLGERGWIGITNLIVMGINCFLLGMLTKKTIVGKDSVWGTRLLFILGIELMLSGIFVIDPLMGFPPGGLGRLSLSGIFHVISSFLMFEALIAACFVLASQYSKWFSVYSIISGFLILLSIVICACLVVLHFTGIYAGGPSGLFERIAMIIGCMWIVAFSALLIRRIRD